MGKSLDSSYSSLRERTRKSLESLVFSLRERTRNPLNFLFIPLRETTGISFDFLLSFSTFQLLSFIPLYFRSISSYFKSSPFPIKRNILWDSMERMGNAWEFSSYLVKKFLGDEKRMRKDWKRMGKKRARNWMEMMGNEWEINGKKRELLGRKWESRWRICEFALFEKFEDIWVCPVTYRFFENLFLGK